MVSNNLGEAAMPCIKAFYHIQFFCLYLANISEKQQCKIFKILRVKASLFRAGPCHYLPPKKGLVTLLGLKKSAFLGTFIPQHTVILYFPDSNLSTRQNFFRNTNYERLVV
jgi:hypothetical protein